MVKFKRCEVQTLVDYKDQLMLVLLIFIAFVGLILLFRKLPASQRDPQLLDEVSKAKMDVQHLQKTLSDVTAERNQIREALSQEQVMVGRLESDRNNLDNRIERMESDHKSALQRDRDAHSAITTSLDEQLLAERIEGSKNSKIIGELNADKRVLEESYEAQRKKHSELREEIENNRAHFVNQFKAISSDLLQNQGKATAESQKNELEKILIPFKQELVHLKSGIKDMNDKAENERQTLGQQILLMQAKATELAEEASSLALALRGDKKRQGNWGETILERILEAAGLIEGTHFTKQATTTDEEGKRLIPDIVVHLPGQRDVIIDSKVTLVAYQDMIQAADDPEKEEAALRRHVIAIKAHMSSLSKKSYDAIGFNSVDSVLMFLPVEGALSAALTRAPDLILEAAEKRVHVMTPSTLMPILKIVDHLWTIDSRNRNVDDIVDRAGRLHDKFVSVVESIDDLGKHLKKASDSQVEAVKRMSEGSGNVLRQVDQLREMGAKTKKTMPAHLLQSADDADQEAEPFSSMELLG